MNSLRAARYPKCITTMCLSGMLPEKLGATAAAGFDDIEIFENDLLNFDGSPTRARQMAADLGLAIMLYQPFRDFEAMPYALFARNLARAERKFDVMAELGVETVLVCSNVRDIAIDDPARAADDLRQTAGTVAGRGLRVGYKAPAQGRHTRTWRQARQIVQQADHPALGLILDNSHMLSLGSTLDGLSSVPTDKLFLVQLADAPRLSMDVLSWSRHHHNFPEQGGLSVTDFAHNLFAAGYTGPLSLEIFDDDFRSAPARLTTSDGIRSLLRLESETSGAELPAAAQFEDMGFLELAVDIAAGWGLGMRLRALGFTFVGHHRSETVDLHRQDHVDMILNMEQNSATSGHFELHRPSVCAIGLKVDDAKRAMTRTHMLCAQEWCGPVGPAERSTPALRAPDGTLLCLIDGRQTGRSIYESDFVLHPGMRDDATRLTSIDRITQVLPAHRLGSFVLFYRAIFSVEAEPEQEIADPYGLVKSRAMASPDHDVQVPLNVSESGRTATGRFITACTGSGVHHIVLRTERLLETIEAIDRGAAYLQHVPGNYYDDVAARLGLDDVLLTHLHNNGLLYDRDPHDGFLRIYTEPFRERFFFRLVRRSGYLGYGTANAVVHMAIQAQLSCTTTDTVDH